MKKLLSIVLSLCMMLSLCAGFSAIPAFAEETEAVLEDAEVSLEEAEIIEEGPSEEADMELFASEAFQDDDFNPFYDEGTGTLADLDTIRASVDWDWTHKDDPKISSNTPSKTASSDLATAFDNEASSASHIEFSNATAAEWNDTGEQWRKTWITIDFGEGNEQTFSGVRVYGRMKDDGTLYSGTQNLSAGNIYVSDDGENWVKADKLNYTSGQQNKLVQEISAKFLGTKYNVTARYIRVEATQSSQYTSCGSAADPWSFTEIRLVNPDTSLATKTITQLTSHAEVTSGDTVIIDRADIENIVIDEITITPDSVVTEITVGGIALNEGTDYSVADNKITFANSYLASLPAGDSECVVTFSTEETSAITLRVKSTDYYDPETYIEEATVGSTLNANYPASKMFDGDMSTYWHATTGLNSTTPEGLAGKTVNIRFTEALDVTGLRFAPRLDQMTGNPRNIYIEGIYSYNEDGTPATKPLFYGDLGAWTLNGETTDTTQDVVEEYKTVAFNNNAYTKADLKVLGLKIVVTSSSDSTGAATFYQYAFFSEIEILKDAATQSASVVPLETGKALILPPVYATTTTEALGDREVTLASTDNLYDGNFTTRMEQANAVGTTGSSTTPADGKFFRVTFSSATPITLSGIRVYQRGTVSSGVLQLDSSGNPKPWSDGGGHQRILSASVYVSNDGERWITLDKPSFSNTFRQDIAFNKDGVAVDVTAKYVKLVVESAAQTTWSASEIAFLTPTGGNSFDLAEYESLKTDADILALTQQILEIEALGDYAANADAAREAIAEVRNAIDGLSYTGKMVLSEGLDKDYIAILEKAEATNYMFEEGDFAIPSGTLQGGSASQSWTTNYPVTNLIDSNFTTRGEIDNVNFSSGNTAYINITLDEAAEFSGIRLYARRLATDTSEFWTSNGSQTLIMGKVLVSSDGSNWIEADLVGSASDSPELYIDIPTAFGGTRTNIRAKYIKLLAEYTVDGDHWAASELRLLKPVSAATYTPDEIYYITSEDIAVDVTDKTSVADETITLSGTVDKVSQVVLDAGTAYEETLVLSEDYTLEGSAITLKADLLKSLTALAHTVTVNFVTGPSCQISLNITDDSQVEYYVIGVNNEGTVALNLVNAKGSTEVTGVSVNGTELSLSTDVTVTESAITINRVPFRKAALVFDDFGVSDGQRVEVPVVVSYGESQVTYTVYLIAPWKNVTDVATTFADSLFRADEIKIPDNSDWRIRADSAVNSSNHPVYAFAGGEATADYVSGGASQKWHAWYGSYNGNNTASDASVIDERTTRFLDLDLGENVPSVGGIRWYPRNASDTASWQRVVIYGKNSDSDEWSLLYDDLTPKSATGGKRDLMFDQNASYRYLRLRLVGATHATAFKVRLIKPASKILSSTLSFEKGFEEYLNDASISISPSSDEVTVTSLMAGSTSITNYSYADGTLTIGKEALKELEAGAYTLTVTFSDGSSDTVDLTVSDSSFVDFAFASKPASGTNIGRTDNIVLKNLAGKEVSSVKLDGTDTEITHSATSGEITITRENFRKAFDVYSYLGLSEGSVKLAVTFEDEDSLTYTVKLSGDFITKAELDAWGPTVAQGAARFEEDEIDITALGSFAVRTDSAWNSVNHHPVNAFYEEYAPEGTTNTNYHANTDEGSIHYIDIDLGEEVMTGGIRYIARYDGGKLNANWANVEIKGSDDFNNWESLAKGSGLSNTERVHEFIFSKNVSYRYLRIYLTGYAYPTADAIRILKPIEGVTVKVESVGGTISGGVTGDNVFQKGVETTLTATPDANSTFKYWIEVNTGKIITTEAALTLSGNVGRNIRAVFAGNDDRFITFYGKNKDTIIRNDSSAKTGELISEAVIPTAMEAYKSGFEFAGWRINNAGGILTTREELGTEATEYYAAYEKAEVDAFEITLGEGASITSGQSAEAIPFGETVVVSAEASAEAGAFKYWTLDGVIVSYSTSYTFVMPGKAITLTPVYGKDAVTEELSISMIVNPDEVTYTDGTKVAGFMVTRYVPEGVNVIESGVIYVRDSAYGELNIDSVGKEAENKNTVKASLSKDLATGQYKFNARYEVSKGIKAIAFITYKVGDKTETIYSAACTVEKK